MKAVYLLLFLALAAPLLALLPTDEQDPQGQTDWTSAVEKATSARRYMMRVAAARKIAAAGAEAVPAVEAYIDQNGLNALPAAIVDMIAKQETTGDAVVEQLLRWARTKDFYWRPAAMLALARRAPLLPERKSELVELFMQHRDDPAWRVAANARLGLRLLDAGDASPRADDDPRLAAEVAGLLLQEGKTPDLQPLVDALANERTFLDVPWGQQSAMGVAQALRRALGDAHPGAMENKDEAIAAVRAALTEKFGQELTQPQIQRDPDIEFSGGIEALSCKNGDVYIQWTADGRIFAGVDAQFAVQLPPETWAELSKVRTTLGLEKSLGVVVCDALRLKWNEPELHARFAPAALPAHAADWLLGLASALANADKNDLAAALRSVVEQFRVR